MEQLVISEPLATRIRAIADRDHLEPEMILERVWDYHFPAPRPAYSLRDEDIEIPDGVDDVQAYCQAVRRVRPKLYRIARHYWAKMGERDKLALTDEELDQVFWLIDSDGIPRFKAEEGQIELPDDPMEMLWVC